MKTTQCRLLSVAEANARLPLVSRIAKDMMDLWEQTLKNREVAHELRTLKAKGDNRFDGRLDKLSREERELTDKVYECMKEVEQLGCITADIKDGIISFPSLCNGQKVFLSWRYGEESVEYWHEVDTDHHQREKISKSDRALTFLLEPVAT